MSGLTRECDTAGSQPFVGICLKEIFKIYKTSITYPALINQIKDLLYHHLIAQ